MKRLTSLRYRRVKRTLLAARARRDEARVAFLEEIERTDAALATEIRSLLEHEADQLPELSGAWIVAALSPVSPEHPQLGPYPIEAELGRGGAGVVYLARDPLLGRKIALKVLPREVAARPARLERFRKEARLLASINHPNIATIHSLEAEHTPPYLSLEFVEGETLALKLARGPLPLDETLHYAQQIARALEAAHQGGVVHRDLKPGNVMVTPAGLVKVVDFGLAIGTGAGRFDGEVPSPENPKVTLVEGTPGYMSPEQIEGAAVDRRADVWAFGCVLFECLTGGRAFGSGPPLERNRRARQGDLDWSRLPRSVPASLHELLRRCVNPDPERRLDSISPVREEIEDLIFRRRVSRTRSEPTAVEIEPPHNLPPTVDSFVGRQRELDEVVRRLREHRVVTLTGAGGTGKTRLALEAARTAAAGFEDGVWFVDLAPLRDPGAVADETARVLGVRPDESRGATELLKAFTAGRRMLLILDNCEHVREGCGELIRNLIQSSAGSCVLATSRELLRVPGEAPIPVPPLRVEDGPTDREPGGSEAVRLFLDRASAANPAFDAASADGKAVVEICRRLDGIPLAIELAAARVRALTVGEIAERLADRFSLLGSGAGVSDGSGRHSTPRRHRSLDALIDWTFQQLSPTERTIFRRLAVFRGGWTLAGAEAVCTGDGVMAWDLLDGFIQLVEKSLVHRDLDGESATGRSRYRMFESIREFAFDQLVAQREEAATTRRHAAYFLSQAEQAQAKIMGEEQAQWVKRIDADYANYRHALATCLRERRDPGSGSSLAAAMGEYWQIRGYYSEAAEIYELALGLSESGGEANLRARLLAWAGNIALARGRYAEARAYHEQGVGECERHGNARGLGAGFNSLGVISWRQGDVRQARAHYERAVRIWRDLGEVRLVGVALNNLGVLDMETGDYASARTHYERSLAIQEKVGNPHAVGVLRANVGLAAMQLGEYDDARAAFENSLRIRRRLGDRAGIAHSLNGLGSVLERRGEPEAARPLIEESLALYEEIGDRVEVSVPLINLGLIGLHLEELAEAETRFHRARELASAAGDSANAARAEAGLGMVALAQALHGEAATRLRRGLDGLLTVEDRWGVAMILEHVALLFEQVGEPVAAARILGFLDAERKRLRAPRTALQQADHDRSVAKLSTRLSRDALARERGAGGSMTLADIIDLARSVEVDDP